ncbi:MAG: hypothetical protein KatS3mg023_3413 [Armatimonadota bacterium]|nr:MAG: hypothetical protein KatS3mg023_3413 [Armatimonadota bacterium]
MKRSGHYGWISMLCLILLGMSSPLLAKVVYVSPQGDDLQDGLSWATAKRTVTAALQTALPGDQIWVRYGLYQERITLKNGVALYGGFRGTESSLSERPTFPRPQPDPYETVLDGGQGGSVVTSPTTANRAYRLDGFTIRNGSAEYGGGLYLTSSANLLTVANCTLSGNRASRDGGGVYCYSSSPALTGCTLSGNSASSGGGVYCYNSSPRLTGCTLSGNSASGDGGGVYCEYNSSPTLSGCTLSGNSASFGGGVYCYNSSSPTLSGCTLSDNRASSGGGVACSSSSPTLTGCTLSGNRASRDGGGVYCYSSSPALTGCTLSGNRASDDGGGVYCDSSSPALTGCTLSDNSASFGGGVACWYNSSPTLTGCTLSGNRASDGGGVYCYRSSPTLTGCTIAYNSASDDGGGVVCYDYSSPTLTGCTLSGNHASDDGGGVSCYNPSSPTLSGCTIAYNSASSGGGVACYSSLTLTGCTVIYNMANIAGGGVRTSSTSTRVRNTILAFNAGGGISAPALSDFRHNCVWGNMPYNFQGNIGNPIGRDGNISEDPLLVAGHLLPGSPCIDRGDNSVVGTDTDMDGEARIRNSTVDIGADECHPPIVQGYLLFNDFGASLPLFVDWEIRAGGVQARTLLLDPDGGFVVANVPMGQFALSVKPLSYLRRTVEVDISRGSVLGLMVGLTNGDIDGDNEVTLFDFGRLVASFGSTSGDGNWDARADLDGDGEVTLFDFGVLVRNFGEIGDD